ncbi:hypothetical protein RYX36_016694 [Vicia faba]
MTDHKYKINFIKTTSCTKIGDVPSIPKTYFKFVAFTQILTGLDQTRAIDVIGHVIKKFDMKETVRSGITVKLLENGNKPLNQTISYVSSQSINVSMDDFLKYPKMTIFEVLQCSKDNDITLWPDVFKSLLEKIMLFKIHVSKGNIKNKWQSYTIVKITTDQNLIDQFKMKHGMNVRWLETF